MYHSERLHGAKEKKPFQPLYYKMNEVFCRSNNVGMKERREAVF
jgi:hypothetical protein